MKKLLTLLLSGFVLFAAAQTKIQSNAISNQNTFAKVHKPVKRAAMSFSDLADSGNYSIERPKKNGLISHEIINNSLRAPMSLAYYSSRTLFDSENPGLPVEDFENANIAPGTINTFPSPLDQFTNNAFFTTGSILPGIQLNSIGNNPTRLAILGSGAYSGNPSKIALPDYFANNAQFLFNPAIYSVGLDAIDLTGGTQCTIEIYDVGGNLLGSVIAATSASGIFWGVKSDTPIGEIRLVSPSAAGADNIAFGNVTQPVPVSDWAIYFGLILIIGFAAFQIKKMV